MFSKLHIVHDFRHFRLRPLPTLFNAVSKRIELAQWDWAHFEALLNSFHYLSNFLTFALVEMIKLSFESYEQRSGFSFAIVTVDKKETLPLL